MTALRGRVRPGLLGRKWLRMREYEDFKALDPDQNDPMVVMTKIARYGVRKVFIATTNMLGIHPFVMFHNLALSRRRTR